MKLTSTICAAIACTMIVSGCAAQTATKANPTQETPTKQATQGSSAKATTPHPGLLDPSKANEKAPAKFQVKFVTTKGDFVVDVTRDWAPNGADRFYNLVKIGYFKDIAIFRAINGFMFQFGIHGEPAISKKWSNANIKDDPSVSGVSNQPGFLTFAHAGPNTRSTQMFINLRDNKSLDPKFPPIGQISQGMDVINQIFKTGENQGDVQRRFEAEGNKFIVGRYPKVDFIKSIELIQN